MTLERAESADEAVTEREDAGVADEECDEMGAAMTCSSVSGCNMSAGCGG